MTSVSTAICREICKGPSLQLLVLDRDAAREFVFPEPYAVISITDPHRRHPELVSSESCRAVLRLTFSDVGEEFARLNLHSPHLVAFSPDHAREVRAFVEEQLAMGAVLLVVHCEAGMSRSAGLAAALARHYHGDDAFFFVHYRPNRRVRNLTLQAFNEHTASG